MMKISKRIFCVALAIVFMFGFVSCLSGSSQAAFTSAQNAYNDLINAYEKIDAVGSDIYEAWRIGIYETVSISNLSEKLNLSSEELNAAADSLVYPGAGDYAFYSFEKI